MRVLILFLCIIIVFLIHIIMQCSDSTSTKARDETIDPVTTGRWRYLDCAVAVLTENILRTFKSTLCTPVQHCENVNVTTTSAAMIIKERCSNFMASKVYIIVISITVVALWKIMLNTKKSTITGNTTFEIETKTLKNIDYLRSILDAMSVGVVATDRQMKITFINSSAGNMCGYSPELAKGKLIGDVMHFKDKNKDFTPCILEENHLITGDRALELHSCDGRYIDVQHKMTPLLLKGDKVGAVILLLDVTVSQNVIRKLSYRASHDALTNLPNRASFETHLQNAVFSSEERNLQHVIAFVDLDGFKMINDGAGHAAGDELLKQIAQLMQSQLRHSDFVARLGGDEFGLILFNCGLSQAKVLISKLVQSVNEYSFCWEGEVKRIGASAGITRVSCKRSVRVLLAEADAACYAAKRRGKGQVCVAEGYQQY